MNNHLEWQPKSAPDDYLIALGAVTLRFNSLEWHHLILHHILSRDPPATTAYRFTKHNNEMRLQVLRSLALECAVGPKGMRLIEDFCKGYDACAVNRNILSHARIEDTTPTALGDAMRATKPNTKGEELSFVFSTATVRKVADEILQWKNFTRAVAGWFLSQTTGDRAAPLPDTPPVPSKMEGSPHKNERTHVLRPPPLTE